MHPTQPGPFQTPPSSHFGAAGNQPPPASTPRSFGAPAPQPPKKSSNAALFWILGGIGCFGVLALAMVGGTVGVLLLAARGSGPTPVYEPYVGGYGQPDPYGGGGYVPPAPDPFAGLAGQQNDPFAGVGAPTDPLGGAFGAPGAMPVMYVPVGDSPTRGPDDALVTIVEFSDFQCPFCSRAAATLERIRTTYGDDVRIVYKHNPLPFHVDAMPAAQLSMAAYHSGGDRGFFQAHDLLFENQRALSRRDLERYGRRLGLSASDIRSALDARVHDAAIQSDMTLAATVGATGTPIFYINGEQLSGAQPYESFALVIDRKRLEAQALVASGVPRLFVYDRIMSSALGR